MRAVSYFLLAALVYGGVLGAQTGTVAPPPWPNQTGQTNAVSNPSGVGGISPWTFVGTSGGTVTSVASPTCNGEAASIHLSPATVTSSNVAANIALTANMGGGHEAVKVTGVLSTDGTFNGTGINAQLYDTWHGGGILFFEQGRTYIPIKAGETCVPFVATLWIPLEHRNDVNWNLRIQAVYPTGSAAAGNVYISDVSAVPDWFPVRSFLKYPSSYLWSDKTPTARLNQGGSTTLGQIDGFSDIDAPQGATVSALNLLVGAAAGCASPLYSGSIASPANGRTHWAITPAQFGGMPAAGTSLYVCTNITTTAGTYAYPDILAPVEDATFRAGLMNYIDEDAGFVHNGARMMNLIMYHHPSSLTAFNGALFAPGGMSSCDQSTATKCYEFDIRGLSSTLYAPFVSYCGGVSCPVTNHPALFTDFAALGISSTIFNFGNFVVVNPDIVNGPGGTSDQLTPALTAHATFGLFLNLQQNQTFGYALSGTDVATAPTWTPTVSTGSGSITASNLYLKVEAVSYPVPATQSPFDTTGAKSMAPETAPSSTVTVPLSTAACAGVNCSATVTTPPCTSNAMIAGYYVFGSTDNSTFHRQPNLATGAYSQATPVACGATETFTSFAASGVSPVATDVTRAQFFPPHSWGSSTTTAQQAIAAVSQRLAASPGGGCIYAGDESVPASIPASWQLVQQQRAAAPGSCSYAVLFYAAAAQLARDLFDIPAADYYAYGNALGAAEYVTGTNITRHTWNFIGTNNAMGRTSNGALDRVDLAAYLIGQATNGSRPCANVVQAWEFGGTIQPGYGEMRRQSLHAIINCHEWGSPGVGLAYWSYNSSNGMEDSILVKNNTNEFEDLHRVTAELRRYEPILIQPVKDSGQIGIGNIVSRVWLTQAGSGPNGSAVSFQTACRQTTTQSFWETLTYGPVGFAIHQDSATGDIYIFADNRCNVSAFDVNFQIISPPTATATVIARDSNGSRTFSLAGGVLTDTWNNAQATAFGPGNDLDAYVYIIRSQQPVHNRVNGRAVISGYVH